MKVDDAIRNAGWHMWSGIVVLATISFLVGDRLQESMWTGIPLAVTVILFFVFVAVNLGKNAKMRLADIGIHKVRLIAHPAALMTIPYFFILIWLADKR